MALSDLFKSSKEKELEKRKAKREKERRVERAIDRISDRVKDLEKERAKIWEKARMLLQNGQKTEAARLLQTYKSQGVMIARYEKQKIFAQNQLNIIVGASDMNTIAEGLGELAGIQDFSPEQLETNLDAMDMVSDDVKDMNKVLDKAFEKDQERLANEADATSDVSVDDDLMKALESEAAAGVLGGRVVDTTTKSESATKNDINAGRNRLKELLGEN